MDQHRYYTIEELIEMIDEPNRSSCARILADNRDLFQSAQGSGYNHQAWLGGYLDHVTEVMNIAVDLYTNSRRPLPFSLSSLLLVLYLHDLEKPWKYVRYAGGLHRKPEMMTKEACHKFRRAKLAEYGIRLSCEEENGMKYVEGENNDYSPHKRVMGPLAALAHICDLASARLYFDYPLEQGDPWPGARRIRG